jgi:PAS domain S-box-containing protein
MKRLFLSFFFFICFFQVCFADILEISSSSKVEVLDKPSYLIKSLSYKEAYISFKNSEFKRLYSKNRSLGFSNEPLWVALKVLNKSEQKQVLSFMYNSLEKLTLYAYQNDKLLYEKKNIKSIGDILLKNSFKTLNSYFELEKSDSAVTYLIKIETKTPMIVNMFIGSQIEALEVQVPQFIFFFISIGSFLSIILFSLFVYSSTKEKGYLLFSIYNLLLGVFISFSYGYLPLIFDFKTSLFFDTLILQLAFIFLIFFSIDFFNINKSNKKLYYTIWAVVLLFNTLFFINNFNSTSYQLMNIFIIIVLTLFCLAVSIISFIQKDEMSKYYIIALGGYLISIIVTLLMKTGLLFYSFFTVEAHFLGYMWQMIVLFLALGQKIKILQKEKNEALLKLKFQEKMLFLQSRQASLGKLIGNITHQWREPLTEISAVWTNVEANILLKGIVENRQIISAIKQNNQIIKHLSQTINVFYNSFKFQSNKKENFSIVEEILNIEKLVYYTLKAENIEFRFIYDELLQAYGNRNEFVNAVLNIVLNAKDMLVKRKIKKPRIKIILFKDIENTKIYIEDNAQGIEEKVINKVFKPGVSTKEDSTGLGLFISKTIIEQKLQGVLKVENILKGARFIIFLPSAKTARDNRFNQIEYNLNESTFQRLSRLEKEVARQSEIEKTLKQWETIFNQAHWAIAFHKHNSKKFESTNPAFTKIYGYTNKELQELDFLALFEEKNRAFALQKQKEAFDKSFLSFEAINIRKDGKKFPVNIDLTVIKNENDEILYYIANIKDITKQKEDLNKILFQKFALDNLYEAIFLLDKKANFCYANKRAYETLGYTYDEILTMGVKDIDINFSYKKYLETLDKLGNDEFIIETLHQKRDKCLFPVRIKLNYFKYQNRIYYMGFCMGYNINNNKNF